MTYTEIIQNLANSVLTRFDEVYHSVEIIKNDNGLILPAIARGDEWIDLAPSDQRETIYIRRNGDDEVQEELKIGSCMKTYKMRSSLRIVYFKDHAEKHREIIQGLMQSVLIGSVKLRSVMRDKYKLQKDESSGAYNFGPTTAYFAIDVYAFWDLRPDTCDYDYCEELENPLKKELCPVAA